MRRALIYIEDGHDKQGPSLLQAASAVLGDAPFESCALITAGPTDHLYGAFDCIFDARSERLDPFDAAAMAALISALHADTHFDCIVMAATPSAVMLAPRLAVRSDFGLVTNVDEIKWQDEQLTCFRLAYGGSTRVGIGVSKHAPSLLTVRADAFSPQENRPVRETRIVEVTDAACPDAPARLRKRARHEVTDPDIRKSAVLVAGGGGIAANFAALRPLADALGGDVAASRAIVDRGLAPRSIQVGLSGNRVAPRLYIALGIHGAIQHVTAISSADYLISVNTNVNAPICSLSDIVVVGDAFAFVDALLKMIKEEKGNGNV
ncbi:electron transfer flavoprotein alpha subunit apoprotein [Cohaesibacter sp. ES.047]|uniref:electron transfer flavoprotein subunit alpha/FixB family protein n=1 Tax=Cohaesibacter sp. ES.047 TaxID=1798205 RepID=UPI000BB7ADD4|nr:electron transfer flavoprotein subunit alpha/FixB family protein [Cohaesibacter sp. ES.047]SNY92385.1 electron transfer flavoprotein alpha subunit apoprotein [Cohaesibacter sp. ES.047]